MGLEDLAEAFRVRLQPPSQLPSDHTAAAAVPDHDALR